MARNADDERLIASYRAVLDSPVGYLLIESTRDAVTGVHFVDADGASVTKASCELLEHACAQLTEYFAGRRSVFDVPTSLDGCGEFQRRVLAEVAAISYGHTETYGRIAAIVGQPKASRAVGQANGRNPISILIPCHRVIGANGALTGYGGGLPAKIWLLRHEGVLAS